MRHMRTAITAFCLGFFALSIAHAATLEVVGGQLIGASGVEVDGAYYHVEFTDGTCIALFNGCDELSDFTFQSPTTASAAGQALLDQVFVDGPFGLFDSNPALVAGCEETSCSTYIPYLSIEGVVFLSSYVRNLNSPGNDSVQGFIMGDASFNTADTGFRNFAVFAPRPVPLPATAPLFLVALAGLALLNWRRRKSSAF